MDMIRKQAELDAIRIQAEINKATNYDDRVKEAEIQNNGLHLRLKNGTLRFPNRKEKHQRSGITVTPLGMRKEKRRMRNKMACASRKINRK